MLTDMRVTISRVGHGRRTTVFFFDGLEPHVQWLFQWLSAVRKSNNHYVAARTLQSWSEHGWPIPWGRLSGAGVADIIEVGYARQLCLPVVSRYVRDNYTSLRVQRKLLGYED